MPQIKKRLAPQEKSQVNPAFQKKRPQRDRAHKSSTKVMRSQHKEPTRRDMRGQSIAPKVRKPLKIEKEPKQNKETLPPRQQGTVDVALKKKKKMVPEYQMRFRFISDERMALQAYFIIGLD